ncbi:MAG: xanthine dehydrogenase family protein subunit M [Acidimicrobiia bacterium]|nr:xanthine dehydrogenase family protein subunit M [Acidimicrobiia bacterium]MYC44573.1 xanthine dehydrogenase family protein subunit M [Acidimicrobiia bacterium]MYI19955.1 xanthine dehydrogenase family protein subunit M [Acidimicrobiia bacterium]
MKPPPFRYVRPDSLEEALALLATHGDEAKVLAGGCSLVPMLNMRLARPEVLVDVNRVGGLAEVRADNGDVTTGAMLRQSAFERSPQLRGALPLTAACAPYIGHFVTRNRGTVGGSLAHADARGELPLVLLTLGGSVLAESRRGRRSIAAEDLFLYHFTSALEPDELLTDVRWPAAAPGWGYGFAEMAQRHGDYALAMAACALRRRDGVVAEVRLGLGAVADRPLLAGEAAGVLVGQSLDGAAGDEAVREAASLAAAAAQPFEDLHASVAYRRQLVSLLSEQVIRQGWLDADDRAGEGGP